MSIEMTALRSRRALLAAAVGVAATTVVSAIEQPPPIRAGEDGDVVLGYADNVATATTRIANATNDEDVLSGESYGAGAGVVGISDSGSGVRGYSQSSSGVGVTGVGAWGRGVSGSGESIGVEGVSDSGRGVSGSSGSGDGVEGVSYSGPGVFGISDTFRGVEGISFTGVGVYAGTLSGTALEVSGKAKFSRSGRVRIPAGASRIDVDLTSRGGLAGTPLILATLQYYRSGVHVAGVRPNYPSAGKFRIYLNKALGSATYVAWFVIG